MSAFGNSPLVLGGNALSVASGTSPVGTAGITATQVAYGDTVANTIKGIAAFTFTEGTGVMKLGVSGSANSISITGDTNGAASIAAAGTNQNITLTPSGTGFALVSNTGTTQLRLTKSGAGSKSFGVNNSLDLLFISDGGSTLTTAKDSGTWLFGTATDSSNGRIQLATHTTSAGGIGFGTDLAQHRSGTREMTITGAGGTTVRVLDSTNTINLALVAETIAKVGTTTNHSFALISNNTTALTLDSSQVATFAAEVRAGSNFRAAASDAFYWNGRSQLRSSASGSIELTNSSGSGGGFSLLQFGGLTSSFPALKRSTTTLAVRLADDSADAPITASDATLSGNLIGGVQALSGAGAVNVTQLHTSFTSTGGAQALTLANGTAGQVKTITHVVDGGSGVLTPTTAVGYTTITFTNAGDSCTLRYTTAGWAIIGIFGAVAA